LGAPFAGSATIPLRPAGAAVIVALANQKGGVGKTTTAVNAAVSLARQGYRVLLVDVDPQGNATSSLGVDKGHLLHTVYDVLVDQLPLARAVAVTDRPLLDLVASTPELAGAEIELVDASGRERRLAQALAAVVDRYHIVLIDCPPSLGLLTVNALTAAHSVVVPIQCEFLALEGVGQLITTIDLVKRGLNPTLDVAGVLMTMYDARTRLSAHVVEEVRRYFPHRIFNAIVPRSIRLAEAPSYGQAIAEYDPGSRGAQAYDAFVGELIDRLGLDEAVSRQPSAVSDDQPTPFRLDPVTGRDVANGKPTPGIDLTADG
jgi:chromosome partitioning protein